MFRLAVLLFSILPGINSEYEASMVQIYGRVASEVPSARGTLLPPANCTTNCYDDVQCILAYMDFQGYCLNYTYAEFNVTVEILRLTVADGFVVAFKTNEITCPTAFTTMDFAYVDRRNDANFPFSWTTTQTGWSLLNPCPIPWLIFKRSETVTICVKAFDLTGKTQVEAKAYCVEQGYKLFGISNENELTNVTNSGNLYERISGDLWVDGTCADPCRHTASEYMFSDGVTTTLGDISVKSDSLNAFCLTINAGAMWSSTCNSISPYGVVCGKALSGSPLPPIASGPDY